MTKISDILLNALPDNDLGELTPCERGAIISKHEDLASNREPGKAQICIGRTSCDNPGDERTVIDIVEDDRPFLIDSIVAEVNRHSLYIDLLIHPHIYVVRQGAKKLDIATEMTQGAVRQSHIHIRLHRLIPKSMEKKLLRGLSRALMDVRLATDDWQALRQKVIISRDIIKKSAANTQENREYADFLDYIYDNNFTLLGYRYFKSGKGTFSAQHKDSLGLLKNTRDIDFLENYKHDLPALFDKLGAQKKPLNIFKMNRNSSVHRRVPVDAISIQDLDDAGKVRGFHLIIGLFTSVTYSRSVTDIPYLRLKVEKIIKRADYVQNSHDDKALRHILEKFPRDELFQIEIPKLQKTAASILNLQERQRIALFMRPDIFGRSVSCMIYITRDRFDTQMRRRFEKILEAELGGETKAYYTTLDDSVFARIILLIESRKTRIKKVDEKRLETMLRIEGRAWDEALAEGINIEKGAESDALIEKYTDVFPTSYRENYTIDKALNDIDILEDFTDHQKIKVSVYHDKLCGDNELRLKLYVKGRPATLSDVLPILENMGLRVISELPFHITLNDGDKDQNIWIHDFLMQTDRISVNSHTNHVKTFIEDAFIAIWGKHVQNDILNKLIISAAMSWREVVIMRTYVHYLRQLSIPFSRAYVSETLTHHPELARLLVDMFQVRFDPAKQKDSEKYAKACRLVIDDALAEVSSLDEDRILRSMLNLIDATLRTNYFQHTPSGMPKDYISVKIDSGAVNDMPLPKPYREIFVYSPRVEGVHLRGGPIARGGIRWSDRSEDYRTEVLGLMKAQQVKNAVIVPVGSKGGFVLKNPPKEGGRKALQAEGIECYKIFIRGLLDITDNRKGAKIIPPKDVVRRDGDDPYLVVAADKGTATFSDTANGLAQEYGFWLDDAFASGGSAGYDHKKMGITARGAWESVKRHFAELNHDIQTQEFDVIGVGDMSGDVFGNGMLLSKKIRLIGAFNHLHIFCDPNPNPESTWKERKRLYDSATGWEGYDESKLSKGGHIYERSKKELLLSPEIQKAFGLSKDRVPPHELMNAMLKARADLLWFGGIGTYIKAESETHLQVGDKANDAIRVNASEVQAKVLGEGANLAITLFGRVEFAKNRGALNADFIDNSGGVDSSDHEVNIKILMQAVMEDSRSKMDLKTRNKLLGKMTETVAQHVLNNNRVQAEAISLMQMSAPEELEAHIDLIQAYEKELDLNRKLEGLPDNDSLKARLRLGKGLTRPELSILQSYAKIKLTNDLLATEIPDHPSLEPWLISYFPQELHKDYKGYIKQHRLGREIIAMKLANNIVNRMGLAFKREMRDLTGSGTSEVVCAYLTAKDMIDLKTLWADINDPKHTVLAYVRLKRLSTLSIITRNLTLWILRHLREDLDIEKQLGRFLPIITDLQKSLPRYLPPEKEKEMQAKLLSYEAEGFPKPLAQKMAAIPYITSAIDVINMNTSQAKPWPLSNVALTYYYIGEHLHFDWLYQKAQHIKAEDKWNQRARDMQIESLHLIQSRLCQDILKEIGKKSFSNGSIKAQHISEWTAQHKAPFETLQEMIERYKQDGQMDLAMLTLAVETLRGLCDR